MKSRILNADELSYEKRSQGGRSAALPGRQHQEVPDVVEYPASGKLGVFAGTPPQHPPKEDSIRIFTRQDDKVDYWHGED